MTPHQVAFLVYGDDNSGRNALTEPKYKDLAAAFTSGGMEVKSVLYSDDTASRLDNELPRLDAVLVWVNPIEQGRDRKKLDALLTSISNKGCFVSAHPDIILKMGTKEVLYSTNSMDWSRDVKKYEDFTDFTRRFPDSLRTSGIRVLKQYRGNGGNGVFKIKQGPTGNEVSVVHATTGNQERLLSWADFFTEFQPFFYQDGLLIDQAWNKNIINGMVRCYLSGSKVAGFGYQEINALYESGNNDWVPPGSRYYFTENCGLFKDLKDKMENSWVPQMLALLGMERTGLPVIWDADFFINDSQGKTAAGKYELCEINVSCVSPFPPSAIQFIVKEVMNKIK